MDFVETIEVIGCESVSAVLAAIVCQYYFDFIFWVVNGYRRLYCHLDCF